MRPVLQAGAAIEDLAESGKLFAEWYPRDLSLYRRQAGKVRLLLGLEESLLREQLLPLFQARVEWPILLRGALCVEQAGEREGELDGLRVRRIESVSGDLSIVLGESLVPVERVGTLERDGRRYEAIALDWSVETDLAGEYTLAAPIVRLAYATQFREDLLQGRVPLDRRDAAWRGAASRVQVMDWPTAGQPPGFRGALGTGLQLELIAQPASITEGEALRLLVRLAGAAQLDPEVLPLIPTRKGLDSISRSVRLKDGVLEAEYELVVQDARALATPLGEWSYLDLSASPPRYAIQPLIAAVEVQPRPPAEPETASSSRVQWFYFLGSLALLGVAWIVYLRRKSPIDVDSQRSRVALATLREQLALPGTRVRAAFELFLALRMGVPLSALPRKTLAGELVKRGVSAGLAQRCQAQLERLESADFAAPGHATAQAVPAELIGLAEELAREDAERSKQG